MPLPSALPLFSSRRARLVFGLALLASGGCASPPADAGDLGGTPGIDPTVGCDATNPAAGCPCATPGTQEACGAVQERIGGDLVCAMGYAECLDTGKWGPCVGDRVVVKSAGDLHLEAYGDAGACADPCNPYCVTTTDTPTGLTLPTGLTNDGGVTLVAETLAACTGLTISPSSAPATNIVVTSSTALATMTFTSALVPASCNATPPAALWYTSEYDVAQMSATVPGQLTVVVPIAGPVTVSAALGTFTASVQSNITVAIQEKGSVNPPPAAASFTQFPAQLGTDPSDANLAIVYPYTGTVLPLGLVAPLLQWTNNSKPADGGVVVTLRYPATGTPIFQVQELVSETMTAPVPLRAAQPRYPIPQSLWFAYEQTVNRNRATYGDAGSISVRRRVAGTTYKAKSITIHSASGQLKGLVYYNSYGTALVQNYTDGKDSPGGAFPNGSFGAATLVIPAAGTAPTVAVGFNGSNGCHGCHRLSADGTTLVTGDTSYNAIKYAFPGTPPTGGIDLNVGQVMVNGGIAPTSTRLLTSAGAGSAGKNGQAGDTTSRLFDLTGALVPGANVPPNLQGGYPAFSSDGLSVAFVFRGGDAKPLANLTGDGDTLSMMTFDGNKTFSNFRNLVTPSGAPSVYPSFLPSGQNGVVYEVETRTSLAGGYGFTRHDCDCTLEYSGATGELWWVSTGTTPVATRLNQANGYNSAGTVGVLPVLPTTGHAGYGGTMGPAGAGFYEQRYNYEPSVLPTVIGGYSWMIFTSRRAYGNVATIDPYASDPQYDDISIDPTPKKLWVSAISSSPTPGTDPSAPAFYLPGQELIAGNSRAVMALQACSPATSSTPTAANLCDSDLDCCQTPTTSSCVLDAPPFASPPLKHCITSSAGACRATGSTCLQTADCCAAATGTVCASGVCTAPPPYYANQTFTRTYAASCAPGYGLRWGLFDWQSVTPTGTSILFSAQTGNGTTWTPAAPVLFATASGASVLSPNWATSGTKVSTALGQTGYSTTSQLLITMALEASTDHSLSPTLVDWRLSTECVPDE